ncbi:glycosyltransferase family 2 protein [Arenibacter algicola]|uniref:Putative glycosyltransferase EpsE n=1 Tax=Arenibacter algicola TaxID=616991 RepID=A0A221UZC3_9FLAO|nr:glycosyltransferase [Arenibacter algicola]ASO06692.1 putative glycosyltransferase EpsE [Arenibacter algicola]
MGEKEITVSVIMITYRHERYIKQAINSVLVQKCNFTIELIIGDDNSPDNTEEVVREFLKHHPKKHLVRYTKHEVNKGMNGNSQWIANQTRGKYIAVCEGDDYWSDPYKLQKQVDFLEENPNFGMVYAKSNIFEENTQKFLKLIVGSSINKKGVLYINSIPTLTTLYRSDLYQRYVNENKEILSNWLMGDYPKWIWFYYNSKIHFINEIMAVYRKLENSASNFIDAKKEMAFKYNIINIKMYYGEKYLNDSEYSKLKNHIFINYYFSALILDPSDSIIYYNQLMEIDVLESKTKTKLFLLERLKLKQLYLSWNKIKGILKMYYVP